MPLLANCSGTPCIYTLSASLLHYRYYTIATTLFYNEGRRKAESLLRKGGAAIHRNAERRQATCRISLDKETEIYQLKIGIADSKPVIWRRVQVSASTTLAELHEIIHIVMGWEDAHLHEFRVPSSGQTNLKTRRSRTDAVLYGPFTDPLGQPFEWFNDEQEDEATITVAEVAPTLKNHFLYTYDMGDNWKHDIVVEKILPLDPEGAYPICIQGERNGPIEDCGGIWGYEEMLAILADPKHEDYRERKTWLKEAFGVNDWPGDAFSLDKINKKLKRLQPRKRRASASRAKKAT